MDKKKKTEQPSEIPSPEKIPEIEPPFDPEEPIRLQYVYLGTGILIILSAYQLKGKWAA